MKTETTGLEIAVVGLAGRFPGAATVEEFWHNLRQGRESIETFSPEEVRQAGTEAGMAADPNFVPASGVVAGDDLFDADFFEMTPREAEILDPQHRFFLEVAVEALERAGYDPSSYGGLIGVYAGTTMSTYLLRNLLRRSALVGMLGEFQLVLGNDKDYLATRVSYKLDLGGPSLVVQSACSTSLVATHLACQGLLNGECDLALAGGVSIQIPQKSGYLFQKGGILSPDGHCRAFDARAEGTVTGSGVGIVVLKRLEDAQRDRDHIHAVIRGSAVNNDGARRVGFTAPGLEGQAAVIRSALSVAEVDPETVDYVETHGSGTLLGDRIELAALRRAFGANGRQKSLAIGSVKTNIGHLGEAAGAAGLIKTVLSLEHGEIPPSLHFETPNPELESQEGTLFVNAALRPWAAKGRPGRAGVSSFGIGGTNAHVVLEAAPPRPASGPSRSWQLLLLSARVPAALERATDNLRDHLEAQPQAPLPDAAFTLQVGRKAFEHRRAVVCRDRAEALAALAGQAPRRLLSGQAGQGHRPVFFLFPGMGDQYPGMAAGLYQEEPVFRQALDRCADFLQPILGEDLRRTLYPQGAAAAAAERGDGDDTPDLRRMLRRQAGEDPAQEALRGTALGQPLLFAVEYALASLWLSWGIRPAGMIGYSLGEYVAACVAGVFSLEDALTLVARRAQLVAALPGGAMLSVALPAEELRPWLGASLALAAVNGPAVSVLAGSEDAVAAVERELQERGVASRRLEACHAFHTPMMEGAVAGLAELAGSVSRKAPEIPFISNVSGDWISAEEATDPTYWCRHLVQPVRFVDGVRTLARQANGVLLEVGPGQGLGSLALQLLPAEERDLPVLSCLGHSYDRQADLGFVLTALARLWLLGVAVDWPAFSAQEERRRVILPTYPFQRQRYWIDGLDGPAPIDEAGAPEPTLEGTALAATALDRASLGETAEAGPGGFSGLGSRRRPSLPNAWKPPQGEAEEQVAGIWQELLGIEGIGAEDSFFDLGGHSLLGTQLLARLRSRFGVEFPLSALFESPTVAGLVARISAQAASAEGGSAAAAPELRPASEGEPATLSFAQERLWFLAQLEPESVAYNLPAAYRLHGELSVATFEAVLVEILRRHAVLRTSVGTAGGRPRLEVLPAAAGAVPLVDLQGLGPERRRRELQRLADREAARPFAGLQAPLLRAVLVRLQEQDHGALVSMHHIASDGWSLGLFVRELGALYLAFAAGRPSPLAPLPLAYGDYARWQRSWLSGSTLERELDHWRQALAGADTVLELPIDQARPPVESHRGARVERTFPAELVASLEALGRQRNSTLFMTLLAAFSVVLHRITGQGDLLVGSPIAGRPRQELEELIGFFVNTLVLRLEPGLGGSFEELLGRLRARTLEAYEHQAVPFERLVEELVPRRDLSRSPLIQVLFALQNAPAESLELPRLRLERVATEGESAQFELVFNLEQNGGALDLFLVYNTDLFEATTVERLADHFGRILAAAVAAPAAAVSALSLLAPAERHQLLAEHNDTAAAVPFAGLYERFAAQAARTPELPAVRFRDEVLSYRQLERRAASLAAALAERGVGPEDRVGIFLERSAEVLVAILGVLRAGAAYLPLDPDYPQDRLAFLAEDAGLAAVVSRGDLVERLPGSPAPVILVDEVPALAPAGEPAASPCPATGPATGPQALAYVLYTSGSTGRPKGVMNSHGAIDNRLQWMREICPLAAGDRVLQKTPLSFDVSVWELFLPLATGAELVFAEPGGHRDPAYLVDTVLERGITTLHFVPSMLEAFLDHEAVGRCAAVLRRVVASGEALSASLAARFVQALPGVELWNLYGPTEAAVDVTFERCAGGPGPVAIGRPVWNTAIHVAGPGLEPAPLGVAGELWIGGVQVARGYLGRPALTAERFVPDPWGPAGARLYRTGDRVRRWRDGRLEYLGRLDFQVKVRGQRIELGEIEATLETHPQVARALVVARPGAAGEARLVAYLTAHLTGHLPGDDDGAPEVGELRRWLATALPEAMVPAAFVALEEFPLTANGKVDRRALPAPEGPSQPAFVAPRTPVEELLAGLWSEVLGLERVGVEDDFFEIGGHSLLATQVVARIRRDLGVELTVAEFFRAPTVASQAQRIASGRQQAGRPLPPLVRTPGVREWPLSFAQERLWFLEQLTPGTAVYNLPTVLRLRGRGDLAALESALGEIVRRHEALRTRFEVRQGEPRQIVDDPVPFHLVRVDLRALGADGDGPRLRVLLTQACERPFDLARGPLLRATVFSRGEEDHFLVLNMHHIVSDAWSMGLLVGEIADRYGAAVADRVASGVEDRATAQEATRAPLLVQYGDFAAWQRSWLQGDELQRQLDFWRSALGQAPATLALATDRPYPPLPSYRGGFRERRLAQPAAQAVRALSRSHGVTPFMVFLAAYAAVLHRASGQSDFVVGAPIANRRSAEVEPLIGFFVNTLALRADLRHRPTFAEALERLRAVALDAYAHQDLPFERLVEELKIERNLSRPPLFQVALVLQNVPQAGGDFAGWSLEAVEPDSRAAKFELTLEITQEAETFDLGLEFAADLFDGTTGERLLGHFAALLSAAAAAPETPVAALPWLSPGESHQVLTEHNDTAVAGGTEAEGLTLHGLVEAQALRTPTAPALVFGGETLSYAGLLRRSDLLALRLRQLGVGPEVRVGVALERSLELPVALLAVLRAGGAYVPLDLDYPPERLRFLVEDAAVAVVVTTESLRPRLPAVDASVLCWEELAAAVDTESSEELVPAPVDGDSLAYVIYTSGSTGRPKGAMNRHAGIVNRLRWMRSLWPWTAEERVLHKTPFSFDVSVWELFMPLTTGGRLVLAEPGGHRDAAYLVRTLVAEQITTAHFVASMLEAFLDAERVEQCLPFLRRVVSSGEAVSAALASRFAERLPGVELWNLYGPTEAAVEVTYQRSGPAVATLAGGMSIGRPVWNTAIQVLDRQLRPLPLGAPGELAIGGVQVARGYWRRPALTAEKFVPDPWGGPGWRLYRTGDEVRRLGDGRIDFLGRLDHQVKLRGQRIELGEIETAVEALPAVRRAVVVLAGSGADGRLVAYLVPRSDAPVPTLDGLQEALASQLPEAMIPRVLVLLDEFPLTPSGKVDRRALAAPERSGDSEAAGATAPRNAVEELLAGLWAELLDLPSVAVQEDFFALGGHSLLATRLVSRMRQTFGLEVPVQEVFRNPTVAGLGRWIEAHRGSAAGPGLPPLVPQERPASALPLSFGQERLWFLEQLEPGSSAYNLPAAYRLTGQADLAVLQRCLATIVERHESLRTTFSAAAGEPHQVISQRLPTLLRLVDLSALPAPLRSAWAEQLASAGAARPFDLAAGPLLRILLVRVTATDHLLLVTCHHIVADGWSIGVLVEELTALYRAYAAGEPSPLAPLPVQYPDFALWQRSWLTGQEVDRQLAFWRDQLAGAPTTLDLPTDRPRPPVQTLNGAVRVRPLPLALRADLDRFGRQQGLTLFMLLQGGLALLLGRWTGSRQIILGTPMANRDRREVEGLIGLFVNTLALATDLRGDPTFAALLERVRANALDAYAHQALPFERLVDELGLERDLSRTPLFQVMLALDNTPSEVTQLPGLELRQQIFGAGSAKFDLTVSLLDEPGAPAVLAEYNTDLFDATTVERFLAQLQHLLEEGLAAPARPIRSLPWMTLPERHQVLAEQNDTAVNLASLLASQPASQLATASGAATLHGLFEAQARRSPEATALSFAGQSLSYGELLRRSGVLAGLLRQRGVGPEVLVGVALERSLDLPMALLAVLRAGGAYVPLDPDYPPERLRFLAEDGAMAVVLTSAGLRSRLPDIEAAVLCLEEVADELATAAAPALPPVDGDALAYVIYTSGSTGRPKGVMNRHAGIVNRLLWMRALWPWGAGERVLQKTPFSFDVSVWELFMPLITGGRLVLAEPGGHRDPAYLVRTLLAEEITTAHFVASMLEAFLEAEAVELCTAGLRRVVSSGEAVSGALAARFAERLPGVELWNLYGPTEAAVEVTFERWLGAPAPGGGMAIGRPVWNTSIQVLDRDLEPVPLGISGELAIGGQQVARGYRGRPALTAERFVPDPWGEAGSRLYRTGDEVRRLGDGRIEFLGRLDHQVKLRGFRIELGEIEAALEALTALRRAVVVLDGEGSGARLAIYGVPADGAAVPTLEALRQGLAAQLPEYMLPTALVVLEELPLTPSGKVDRRALPAPGQAGEASAEAWVAPRTMAERQVAAAFREVLEVDELSIGAGFFELGGHSLRATRLVSRLERDFGGRVPLQQIFRTPTVVELARWLTSRSPEGAAAPPLEPRLRDAEAVLSFAQERLWFIDQLEPGSAAYNIPVAFRLQGSLDRRLMEQALGAVIRRHESLRTVFASDGGRPRLVIHQEIPWQLPVVDLSGLDPSARQALTENLAQREAARPFDLSRGPLLRARLLVLREGEHAMLFNLHHIVSDAWSMGILVEEVTAFYRGARLADAGERGAAEAALPPLAVQYSDFALWQRRWLEGGELEQQLGYWRRQLAGAPQALELPTDRPRPALLSVRGAQVARRLPPSLVAALEELARRRGSTLFMALLAAYGSLLARWSAQREVVVGSPVAGRRQVAVERLIGFFINTLVLRLPVAPATSFDDLLHTAHGVALEAFQHQDVPFERLVEDLGLERRLDRSPLFQALLVVQNAPSQAAQLPELTLSPLNAALGSTKFDFTLTADEDEGGLALTLGFNQILFDRTTAGRFLRQFHGLLAAAVARPEESWEVLCAPPAAERHQLLHEWRGEGSSPRIQATVHGRFSAQARRTPRRLAAVDDLQELSFETLDADSDRLARQLRRLGVRAETRVGLCLHRSVEVATAILAILKAGGAYVPLDPNHPVERQRFVLEDSAAAVLLGHEDLLASLGELGIPVLAWNRGELAGELAAALAEPSEEAVDGASFHGAGFHGAGLDGADLDGTARAENLAYVLYTSGSTGQPKGVPVEHRSVLRLLAALAREVYPEDEPLRVAVNAPLAFDASVKQWIQLLAGHCLVFMDDEIRLDPQAFLPWLRRQRVGALDCTPGQLASLLEAGLVEQTAVRRLAVGGEELTPSLWRQLAAAPGLAAFNVYGPTECTVDTTIARVGAAGPSLGWPVPHARLYVVDERLRPLPVGVAGELLIGGGGLARGYRGRPAVTARHFVADPWSDQVGDRLYRTGDRVRFLADGRLEFLGRLDRQVKVRGYRMELGEIEAALLAQEEVRAVAAVAQGSRLVAYVVGEISIPRLRQDLARRLPEYMIPAVFVPLEALPLTANGKVDRRALPAVTLDGAAAGGRFTLTATEELVAEVWSQVLDVERLNNKADFFDLGGHSLVATRAVSRLREVFNLEVPVRQIFQTTTVGSLARWLDEQLASGRTREVPPIVAVSRDQDLPLSYAQERLWFLEQLNPGSAVYNIPDVFRLRGALNVRALHRALHALSVRQETFRTVIVARGGRPFQRIQAPAPWPLPNIDLSGLPLELRLPEAERLALREVRQTFDLATGPLLRTRLLRIGKEDYALTLAAHHIASDGWSMGILVGDLGALYDSYAAGLPSPMAELQVQYADFAVWQRRWLESGEMERQLDYWRRQLAGAPTALELPTDRPRPALQKHRGGQRKRILPPTYGDGLRRLGREEGATLFMTCLVAFGALLSRSSGQPEVVVGAAVANRIVAQLEGLVGFFVNSLTMRVRLGGRPTFRQALREVRQMAFEAYEHQDVPFERLVDALHIPRALDRAAVFQTMMVVQNVPHAQVDPPGLQLQPIEATSGTSKFDMTLAIHDEADKFELTLEYDADLFDDVTMERFLRRLTRVYDGAIRMPDLPLDELTLALPAEEHQLLREWNDTAQPRDEALTVLEMLARQARQGGDRVAVEDGEEALTFDQLVRQGGRVAAALARRGVGPESVVALLFERSVESVVAAAGVLAAGAAYLPLDPALPAERLAFMVRDSGAPLVLASEKLLGKAPEGMPVATVAALLAEAEGELWRRGEADGLAYVIYTSGSTGQPKGVAIHHRGLANLIHWCRHRFGLAAGGRSPQLAGPAFDASVLETWPALASGMTLVLVDEEVRLASGRLMAWLAERRITYAFAPTPLAEGLLREEIPPGLSLEALSTGGDRLHGGASAQSPFVLHNLYGPTEGSVVATAGVVAAAGSDPWAPAIGRPLENMAAYVLDRRLRLALAGSDGELVLAGVGLARGYLGQPAWTAERFVPDPFGAAAGGRLYRTGDRVRHRRGGPLDFQGRLDQQVKIRGVRIELGEIEAVLARHPQVAEAAVLAREDGRGEPRLVAYVVAAGGRPETGELREFLGRELPEVMVPSEVVHLEALPLTANGKLDRGALPDPSFLSAVGQQRLPRDLVEYRLWQLWQAELERGDFGVTDDFFAVGGHSLMAVRLLSRIEGTFGRRLPVADLFRRPTVELLAQALRQELTVTASLGATAGAGSEAEDGPEDWLVRLRPGGEGPPLFLLHPIGGTVFCYALLVQSLGAQAPVFGVQGAGPDGASLEQLAELYLARVEDAQPRGPLHLAGWSFGGVLAFEMARQAAGKGRQIGSLTLIDSHLLTRRPEPAETMLLATFFRDLTGGGEELAAAELEALPAEERWQLLLAQARRCGALPADSSPALLRSLYETFRRNLRALAGYRPQRYGGPVTLVHPVDGERESVWEAWVGDLRRVGVAADHFRLLAAPAVAAVATVLDEALEGPRPEEQRPEEQTPEGQAAEDSRGGVLAEALED